MTVFKNKIEQQKHETCGPVKVELKKIKSIWKNAVAMTEFSQILQSSSLSLLLSEATQEYRIT